MSVGTDRSGVAYTVHAETVGIRTCEGKHLDATCFSRAFAASSAAEEHRRAEEREEAARWLDVLLHDAELRSRQEAASLAAERQALMAQFRLEQRLHGPGPRPPVAQVDRSPMRALPPLPTLSESEDGKWQAMHAQRAELQQRLCGLLKEFSALRAMQDSMSEGALGPAVAVRHGPPFKRSEESRGAPRSPRKLLPPPRPVFDFDEPALDDVHSQVQAAATLGSRRSSLGRSSELAAPGDTKAEVWGPSSPYATSSTTVGHLKATPSAKEESFQAAMSFASLPVEEASTLGELVHLILGGASALRCVDAVTAEQGPALASALESPAAAALEVLILSSNELGPEGMEALSASLPRCYGLRRLDTPTSSLGASWDNLLFIRLDCAGALPK
eukprot:s35_g5.t1